MNQKEKLVETTVNKYYPNFTVIGDNLILSMNQLAISHVKMLNQAQLDNGEILSFLDLVNLLCQTEDKYILGIVEVGFLEVLTDSKISQQYSFDFLKGDALNMFVELFNERFTKLF